MKNTTDDYISIYVVHAPEGVQHVVSLLSTEIAFSPSSNGLAPEAIIGICNRPLKPGETLAPANFARNRIFVDFLHDVIARRGPENPSLQSAARKQGDGCVYIIDGRTPDPEGDVPRHDIIGAFGVKQGEIDSGSYEANPHHVILSPDGFFQLDPTLLEFLMEELVERNSSGAITHQRPWWKLR